ncbi:hypothetical protein QP222_13105, partial [Corynebacterium pyruviciproducens]|uniref:hypothetical protein n=1 Tax=Corynebacterium pyruviciproducens TaxID=598660 RepID=UPI00254D4992
KDIFGGLSHIWVRGSGREEQPHIQRVAAERHRRAERSYFTFKVRMGDFIQGKEQQLHFAGAAVKRYPTSRVRETQVRQ